MLKTIKTSELTGAALDWAVAKCEGRAWDLIESFMDYHDDGEMRYSTDWAQGGLILEREGMCISRTNKTREEPWAACIDGHQWVDGSTILIATMRSYVTSRLGDTVEIPEELI